MHGEVVVGVRQRHLGEGEGDGDGSVGVRVTVRVRVRVRVRVGVTRSASASVGSTSSRDTPAKLMPPLPRREGKEEVAEAKARVLGKAREMLLAFPRSTRPVSSLSRVPATMETSATGLTTSPLLVQPGRLLAEM